MVEFSAAGCVCGGRVVVICDGGMPTAFTLVFTGGAHEVPKSAPPPICHDTGRPRSSDGAGPLAYGGERTSSMELAAMDAAKRTAVSAILSDSAAASTPFGFLYGAPSLDDAYHLVMDRYLASFDGIGPIDSFPVYTALTDQFLPRPPCFCADVAFPYLLSSFMVYLYTANPQQDTID